MICGARAAAESCSVSVPPILIAGVTGVLVTAILFGVRKGKIKGIENRLAYERHHAVHWDPARGAFVF